MHLLVAAHDFYPDPGSGGTGRYVHETARRLVDRGHRVSVVTRRRGDVARHETVAGIEVFRYDIAVADRIAVEVLPQLPGAARTVSAHVERASRAEPVDLVSFQGPVTSVLVDRAVGDDVARSATFHSPWPTEYLLRTRTDDRSALRRRLNVAVRKRLENRTLSRADDAVALSEFMCGECRRLYGVDPAVVPGGVDTERFAPDAGTFDRMDVDGPTFLTVRRLSPRMGHDLLLEAFARVRTRHPDARLFIAGDGPLRDPLERTAAALGIDDRTAFLGYVPDADLPNAYATADVFVLPTTELEGFGLATLEALASGTPVVGTAVGGTAEVLGPLDGSGTLPARALVRATDSDALARRMNAWADLPAAERDAAGRACRTYACDRYTWDRTVDALEARYRAQLA